MSAFQLPEAEIASPPHAPRPLPADTHRVVMPLDSAMLPPALWDFVADTSDRQQSPPDFVAMAGLCALSGVLGRKIQIQPKANDTGWKITPNLWGALIGLPSSMKSPTLKSATAPLDTLEFNARNLFDAETKATTIEIELNELAAKTLRGEAKTAGKDALKARHLMEQALELESALAPPIMRRLTVNDATVEKLGELLNQNPNGMILLRDEMSGWLAKMNASDAGQDRAFYLEAFNGDGSYTYDRIGRGTVRIESCTLAMIGGIQPSKLMPLVRGAVTGQADDGLLQRLQLAVWPEASPSWEWRDRKPCARSEAAYRDLFMMIDDMPRFDPTSPRDVPVMHLDSDALGLFAEWSTELNTSIRSPEEATMGEAIQSHLLKMPQTVIRLAGLFAVIAERGIVSGRDMLQALALSDYLQSHAHKIYGLADDAALHGARLILERKTKLGNPFTARELRRKAWSGLSTSDDVAGAVDVLIEYGHIVAVPSVILDGTGRPTVNFHFTEAAS
jgi:hypothetical protein